MTNTAASTLDFLTYVIDADGVAHGDLFCAPADSGEWIVLPAGQAPENACACAADALPPLRTSGMVNVAGPSQDTPDWGTGTGSGQCPRPMTEKQEAFITRLLAETGADPEAVGFRSDIGSKAASAVIDKLLGIKDHQPAAPAPTASEGFDFAAAAEALGRKFTADDLTADLRAYAMTYALGYDGDFSFMVDMRDAARRGRLSDGMAKGVLNCARADLSRKAEVPAVAPGRYAYAADDGHTVFVKVWKSGTGASYLTGGGPDGELVEAGVVPRAAKATVFGRIAEDPAAAAALFGEKASRCSHCGRGLADEDNPYFSQGYGPDCGAQIIG